MNKKYNQYRFDGDICIGYQNITSSTEPTYGSIQLASQMSFVSKITLAEISLSTSDALGFLLGTFKLKPQKGSTIIGAYDEEAAPMITIFNPNTFVWNYPDWVGYINDGLTLPISVIASKFTLANNTEYTLTVTPSGTGAYLKKNS